MGRPRSLPQCFSPLSDPGNHGTDPRRSLQVAPFRTESSSIWIGYRDEPLKKYLGVFPSLAEVTERCRNNFKANLKDAFPRYNLTATSCSDASDYDYDGSNRRRVCCGACQEDGRECEPLFLEFLHVDLPQSTTGLLLIAFNFYVRGEKLVALVHHSSRGHHYFQKTDGHPSKVFSMQSNHSCVINRHPVALLGEGNGSDADSSLTSFESFEEAQTEIRESPRMILRSQQSNQHPQPLPSPQSHPAQAETQQPPTTKHARSHGFVVVDLTEEEDTEVKQEDAAEPISLLTPPATREPITPERSSISSQYGPDPLVEEYGRITTQIFNEYSMRVFQLPEIIDLMERMKQAVRAGDRPALCRAYGALQAFLITID